MSGINKILKTPFYRVVDYLASTDYVRDKLWEMGRDLFGQVRPEALTHVPLLPIPPQYGSIEKPAGASASGLTPVFITARFRSGSTFLWQLFKGLDGFSCHYEPLNEAQWFLKNRNSKHVDETHIGVEEYGTGYEGMEDLSRYFNQAWAFNRLYMDASHHDPDLERYLSELISRANGRAVLQFNRVDFRLPWLRAHFPHARILHLYRHPREQWMSIMGKGARCLPDETIKPGQTAPVDGFYTLEWALDLRHVFPLLEPAGRHPYELHYLLWRLSYSYGRAYADMSICYEDLIADFERVAGSMFQTAGILDADIAQLAKLNHGKQTMRWPEYANEAWFNALETKCDRELQAFFSSTERHHPA